MYKSITAFESISVRNLQCKDGHLSAVYTIKTLKENEKTFKVHYTYYPTIDKEYISPFAGLIVATPLINYALFF